MILLSMEAEITPAAIILEGIILATIPPAVITATVKTAAIRRPSGLLGIFGS